MKMHIHIHIHNEADAVVVRKLNLITNQLLKMPTKAEFEALRDELTSALENIAADITRLTDQLETGGLSADEEAEVFAGFRAIADRAAGIAGQTPEPPAPDA